MLKQNLQITGALHHKFGFPQCVSYCHVYEAWHPLSARTQLGHFCRSGRYGGVPYGTGFGPVFGAREWRHQLRYSRLLARLVPNSNASTFMYQAPDKLLCVLTANFICLRRVLCIFCGAVCPGLLLHRSYVHHDGNVNIEERSHEKSSITPSPTTCHRPALISRSRRMESATRLGVCKSHSVCH